MGRRACVHAAKFYDIRYELPQNKCNALQYVNKLVDRQKTVEISKCYYIGSDKSKSAKLMYIWDLIALNYFDEYILFEICCWCKVLKIVRWNVKGSERQISWWKSFTDVACNLTWTRAMCNWRNGKTYVDKTIKSAFLIFINKEFNTKVEK